MKFAKQRGTTVAALLAEAQSVADFCAANPDSLQAFFFNEAQELLKQWDTVDAWKAGKRRNK